MQPDLPIHALREPLHKAWTTHNRLVIIAPTGSGKTTQVCQMLLADGAPNGKRIVVLQPRRVAARSVARRVAEEMNSEVGAQVGYQVRFDERLGENTQIAFVTEGILLRWLESDPSLSTIGAVLFDEFHERNLLSDVALALCIQLQQQSRSDLRLIVMSATLEARPIAKYLGNCPILESDGRSYPVDIRYQTWGDDSAVWERAAQQVVEILRTTDDGDVLVFMPGMYEIQRTMDEVRQLWREVSSGRSALSAPTTTEPVLLPLHGEMSPREQDRVFAPSTYRRVIVATNVAETSITLPGIRFVVDGGLARVARYDPTRGVNTLHIEPVSQASAAQRAGRAGRVAPGMCYRLWSHAQHATRPLKNTPEVQRTELSSVVLLLHSLGVRDVAQFDFLDNPDAARIQAAETLLESLGAVVDGNITDTGRAMLRIPTHPRYARMLIEAQAQRQGCVRDVALLAALVSGRELLVRLTRNDKVQQRNRNSLITKVHKQSDYFLLAKSFEHAVHANFDSKTCYAYGVHPHAAREVAQTFAQLLDVCAESGLLQYNDDAPLANPANAETIQRCHLVGFVDHLAVRTSSGSDEYDLTGGRRCTLMDESIVGQNMLIVASEIREITTRSGERLTLLGFGSAVTLAWVRELNPPGLQEQVEHVYDRLNKRVVAGRVVRFHDLLIGGERVPDGEIDLDKAAQVLANEFADHLDRLPQWNKLKPLIAQQPTLTREQIAQTLAECWHGATTLKDALARDVVSVFTKTSPTL